MSDPANPDWPELLALADEAGPAPVVRSDAERLSRALSADPLARIGQEDRKRLRDDSRASWRAGNA